MKRRHKRKIRLRKGMRGWKWVVRETAGKKNKRTKTRKEERKETRRKSRGGHKQARGGIPVHNQMRQNGEE